MTITVVLFALVACLAIPASAAQAAPLSPDQAKAQATQAVAPLAVERVVCVRPSRRRAVCTVAHPAPEGSICRSFVVVGARTRVSGLNVCMSRAASAEAGR
jgi:hypothetical protein